MNAAAQTGAAAERVEDAIIREARQSYERLPMLEVIFDRMILSLAPDLKAYCAVMPEVTLNAFTYTSVEDALAEVASPAILAVSSAEDWEAPLMVGVEPDLLFVMLETMLGGRAGRHDAQDWTPRSFTQIEKRIGRRLCEIALESLAGSFANVAPVTFAVDQLESTPQSMVLAAPTTPAVRVRLTVTLHDRAGHMVFVLPYAAFERLRPLLAQGFLGGQIGGDSGWRRLIRERLETTSVTVTALLHEFQVPLVEALNWNPGQTLDLGVTTDQQITAVCHGKPMFKAGYGQRRNGSLALRVTHKILEQQDGRPDDVHDD